MTLKFDLNSIDLVEFGVGLGRHSDRTIARVPVTDEVSGILRQMVETTWHNMQTDIDHHRDYPRQYELSEKYSGTEYVVLSSTDPLASTLAEIHAAVNLDPVRLLDVIDDVSYYFVRLVDVNSLHVTAIKRNIQFTGLIKKKVLAVTSDTLKLTEEKLFKLDHDFDLLIDTATVHIWRPNSFRLIADLNAAIMEGARGHLSGIQKDMPFIDFSSIAEYVSTRARPAQYVAVINSRGRAKDINLPALEELCEQNSIELTKGEDGRLRIGDNHIMPFLEVLDRRRYKITLVQDNPELYRAASRVQL